MSVWLPRPCKYDLSRVEAVHGPVTVAFDRSVNVMDLGAQRRIMAEEVLPMALPDDLVLLIGPNLMIVNFVVSWLDEFGLARVLTYKRSIDDFVERTFRLSRRELRSD